MKKKPINYVFTLGIVCGWVMLLSFIEPQMKPRHNQIRSDSHTGTRHKSVKNADYHLLLTASNRPATQGFSMDYEKSTDYEKGQKLPNETSYETPSESELYLRHLAFVNPTPTINSYPTTHRPKKVDPKISVSASMTMEEKTLKANHALGEFLLTAYTIDASCTGKTPSMPDYGVTATGTHAKVNRTIAVDPSIIPYGSLVWIEGVGMRVAEDTGGAIRGHHIDVLLSSRNEAVNFGVKHHRRVVLIQSSSDSEHPL